MLSIRRIAMVLLRHCLACALTDHSEMLKAECCGKMRLVCRSLTCAELKGIHSTVVVSVTITSPASLGTHKQSFKTAVHAVPCC